MKCPACARDLPENRQGAGGAYCECGWLEGPNEIGFHLPRAAKRTIAAAAIVGVGLFSLFLYGYSRWGWHVFEAANLHLRISLDLSTEQDEHQLGRICNSYRDYPCSVRAFSRLIERNPSDASALANLAMAETEIEDFQASIHHYEAFFNLGGAGTDVMYRYAQTLAATGQTEEAIRWYYNTIQAYPSFVDPLRDLTALLSRLGRHAEALALLMTLSEEYPELKELWQGQIVVLGETISAVAKARAPRTIRMAALQNGMHYVPVRIGPDRQYQPFLFDTGASNLVLSRTVAEAAGIVITGSERKVRLQTADRTGVGVFVQIPELWVGPWRLRNTEAIVCEGCASLFGKSIISRFDLHFDKVGSVEMLTLTHREISR